MKSNIILSFSDLPLSLLLRLSSSRSSYYFHQYVLLSKFVFMPSLLAVVFSKLPCEIMANPLCRECDFSGDESSITQHSFDSAMPCKEDTTWNSPNKLLLVSNNMLWTMYIIKIFHLILWANEMGKTIFFSALHYLVKLSWLVYLLYNLYVMQSFQYI